MQSLATRLRWALEPFHAVCYFAPDVPERFTERGLHPWAAYFGQRAAPMGYAAAETVAAAFYVFDPRLVARSIPSTWNQVSPDRAWEWRLDGVDRALRRFLGDDWCRSGAVEDAAAVARTAAGAVAVGGRPLGAPTAGMPEGDEPHLRLWSSVTALREQRGDGHVSSLVAHGVGPVESMVTAGEFSNLSQRFHRRNRGWSEEGWERAIDTCRSAGWIDAAGVRTDAGTELRRSVERSTDVSMRAVGDAIGEDGIAKLIDVVGDASRRLSEAAIFPF